MPLYGQGDHAGAEKIVAGYTPDYNYDHRQRFDQEESGCSKDLFI